MASVAAEGAGLPSLAAQALAIDPTNSQIVYAGTTNGVCKTVDAGASWNRVDSGLTYTNVLALAIDPNAPCSIYAGIDSGLFNIGVPPKHYRSEYEGDPREKHRLRRDAGRTV